MQRGTIAPVPRLDHLVMLVGYLDRAVRDYEELGFTVTPGGEHADGLTHNALIPFRDGSYFPARGLSGPEGSQGQLLRLAGISALWRRSYRLLRGLR
jgi:Glyoxalase-like domain